MKIKIGRLELYCDIYIHLKPKVRSRKVKGVYTGMICDICGIQTKGDRKTEHVQEKHPEYAFFRTGVSCDLRYTCDTCGMGVGGVKGVINHYRERHPEKVTNETS